MPIYEYECPTCGRFDVIQKMSAAPLETHEKCGSKVTKLMSAGAFSFKGSGFYQTDYRSEGYKKAADADKPVSAPTPDSAPKSDAKVETKAGAATTEPASKAGAKAESTAESKPPSAKADSKPANAKRPSKSR